MIGGEVSYVVFIFHGGNDGVGVGHTDGVGIGLADGVGIGLADGVGFGRADGVGVDCLHLHLPWRKTNSICHVF